jgi:hypothetical protein
MGRVLLACLGLPPHEGARVAADVAEEFTHRPWQKLVSCQWDGIALNLIVDSDRDLAGEGIADELSDAVAASWSGEYSVRIVEAGSK